MKTRTKEEKQEYIASLKAAAELIDIEDAEVFWQHTAQKYSLKNCQLVLAQMPEATTIAGFNQWKEAGRVVRKGEKGLAIFAPFKKKGEASESNDSETPDTYFRIVYVFDITQTDLIEAN
jgi:hypothetical protein